MSSAAHSTEPPARGAVVFDRYQLVMRLGDDARGETWLGASLDGGPPVEVRVLTNPTLRARAAAVWEAIGEGLLRVASVDDLNVERVVCAGVASWEAEPAVCVVAERVEGRDLFEHLRERGRLDARDALAIALQIAGGLNALHAGGVVHGDLRPQRVRLVTSEVSEGPLVILSDVGTTNLLITAVHDSPALLEIVSPDYVAPEQIEGEPTTAATDVYAVGLLLYRMLSGCSPFNAGSMRELLIAQLSHAPVALRARVADLDLSTDLERVVMRCLAKRPQDRFPSARALYDALAVCLAEAQHTRTHEPEAAQPFEPARFADDPRPSRPFPTASGITSRGANLLETTASTPPEPVAPQPAAAATSADVEPPTAPSTPPRRGPSPAAMMGLAAAMMLAAGLLLGFTIASRRRPAMVAPRATVTASTIRLTVRSRAPHATVLVRGHTYPAPLRIELPSGTAPELVEVAAPGLAARRLWMVLDCNTEAQIDLDDAAEMPPAQAEAPRPSAPVVPLNSEVVQAEIARHAGHIEDCLHRARQQHPTLSGAVPVTIVIAPDGHVRRATWPSNEPEQLRALGCITSRIRRWRFPASGYGGDFLTVQTFDLGH